MMEIQWAAALVVGLLGGVHCVGMCGGIVSALTFGLPAERRASLARMLPLVLAYNLGRILSYGLAGAVAGGFGYLLAESLPLWQAQRVLYGLAGLFMVLMGLYLGGWWALLGRLERLGGRLWSRLEPLGRRLLPVSSPPRALVLGLVWGWIPCGLVYSTLVWALSSGGAWQGAALMLAFGLGTLPNLLGMSFLVGGLARWSRQPWVRRLAGGLVTAFGLWTLWQALAPA